jgi:hypothetical protein
MARPAKAVKWSRIVGNFGPWKITMRRCVAARSTMMSWRSEAFMSKVASDVVSTQMP